MTYCVCGLVNCIRRDTLEETLRIAALLCRFLDSTNSSMSIPKELVPARRVAVALSAALVMAGAMERLGPKA
ncbi:hypothetical protein ACFFYR_34795 [Paraburkholderia dipogonis]|uniref:hypothetical protein n=1 Tax=Paraburkholderia dipogonis TaxID=1211383 RepID=UPI0035EDE74E